MAEISEVRKSPGGSWMMKNDTSDIPNKVGIM